MYDGNTVLLKRTYTLFYSFLEEYNSETKGRIKIEPFDQCGGLFKKPTRRNELKFCSNSLDCEKNVGKLSRLSNSLLVMKTLNIQRNTNAKFFKNVFRAAWNFHSRHDISHNKTNMIASDQCNKLFGRTDNMLQHKKNKHWKTFGNICLIWQIEGIWIKFVKLYFYDNFFS